MHKQDYSDIFLIIIKVDKLKFINYSLQMLEFKNKHEIQNLIKTGQELSLAIDHYPSRGQTTTQKLYHTKKGKLFLKKVSLRNHKECQINVDSGTLAEREFWAYQLADDLRLSVPQMILLDSCTTVQAWLDLPDAHHFITDQGPLDLDSQNVFECACFDWLTGQIDRHDANYLYDFINKKIILIDSAHAFLQYDGSLPHYLQIFESSSPHKLGAAQNTGIIGQILSIQNRLTKLVPLRASAEREALKRRLQQLLGVKSIGDIITLYRKQK